MYKVLKLFKGSQENSQINYSSYHWLKKVEDERIVNSSQNRVAFLIINFLFWKTCILTENYKDRTQFPYALHPTFPKASILH
jgi:hypothetical protein